LSLFGLPVLDTFTDGSAPRALSTYDGTNWGGALISGDPTCDTQAGGTITASSGTASNVYKTVSAADVAVFATCTTKPANGEFFELALRVSNEGTASPTMYLLAIFPVAGTDTWELWKCVAGSPTQVTNFATAELNAGDEVGFVAVGNTLSVYQNGVCLGTVTDTSITSAGKAGVRISGTTCRLDDFGVGTDLPPQYVAAGTQSNTATNGASLSPGIPSGMQAGDLMILVAAISSNTALSDPAGWTAIPALTGNNTAAQRHQVYYRYWQSGDTAPSLSNGGTIVRAARIFGFRFVAAAADGGPFDVTSTLSDNAASATIASSSITTATAEAAVAFFGCYEDDPTSVSTPAGYVRGAWQGSSLGTDMALGLIGTKVKDSPGAENPSATVSGGTFANSVNSGMLVGLMPISTGPAAFSLDASPGSFALTGTASKPVADRLMGATPGSYALTGDAGGLALERTVLASPGSYAVTGDAAALPAARVIPAAPGSFALVGDAAGVLADRVVGASPGAYVITGTDADLAAATTGFVLNAAAGSFAISGDAAGLLADRLLDVAPGSVDVTGDAATLPADRVVKATPGAYSVTGADADVSLPGAFTLDATPAAFTLTGSAAGTLATRKLDAAPGAYALTGDDVAPTLERVLLAGPGAVALTGAAAILAAAIAARIGSVLQVDSPTASVALAEAAGTVVLSERAGSVELSQRPL